MNLVFDSIPKSINASIQLEGSKSISNRLLILQALCDGGFEIENLSPSNDTITLNHLLQTQDKTCNVGAAGTTMRFLTAFFATRECEKILTGSARMQQRPIKILVDALQQLGAEISYLDNDGYPPILIKGKVISGGDVTIRADVSSQYISALLMVAPYFKNGLNLHLSGKISSFPYINMTLKTMEELGVKSSFNNNIINIPTGKYISKKMQAESDWSAASYYFSVCALSSGSKIAITGLLEKSLQGDSVLPEIYQQLGVQAHFENGILLLQHTGHCVKEFVFDFSDCPDLAQTVAVTCAGLGIAATFSGLESLQIKETDRTAALQNELKKFEVQFYEDGDKWKLTGKTKATRAILIDTYEDHRMAMCFAPLSIKHPQIIIDDPMVVKKSYPSFWDDFSTLGFISSIS